MHSKYHFQTPISPISSLGFKKSSSIQNFYRQATQRSLNYQSPLHNQGKDCVACKHQKQRFGIITNKRQTNETRKLQSIHKDEYYATGNSEQLMNLRKAKRFLEDMVQKLKQEYRITVDKNEARIAELSSIVEQKNAIIEELERKINLNQLMQQYGNNVSLVGTYFVKDELDEQKDNQNRKIKDMAKQISNLEMQIQELKQQALQDKKKLTEKQQLQPKLRQYEIYAKQYESMKLLIHKMEVEKEQVERRQSKTMNELVKRHKMEVIQYTNQLNILKAGLQQRQKQLDNKQQQIEKTRNISIEATQTQFEHLQQLIEQKDEQIEKLQSKITCIESELTFLKNRYGYLLKLSRNNGQINQVGSTSDLQEYCIERVGRHNLSNGKQSLIGLNLSPIKRR